MLSRKGKYEKMLKNKDLVKILLKHDPELPLKITRDGNGCDYGIDAEDIEVTDGGYFGNYDCDEEFDNEEQKFLRIGLF